MNCDRCDGCGSAKTYENQVQMPINGRVRCIDWCIHPIVAALNAGGVTIHSFFRFHKDIRPEEAAKKYTDNPDLYRNLECLVIDEISMVRADMLDCVDGFLQKPG